MAKIEIITCILPLMENVSAEWYGGTNFVRLFIGREANIDIDKSLTIYAREAEPTIYFDPREGVRSSFVRGAFRRIELWIPKGGTLNRYELHLE